MRESRDKNRRALSIEPGRNLTFEDLGPEEEPAKEPLKISGNRKNESTQEKRLYQEGGRSQLESRATERSNSEEGKTNII